MDKYSELIACPTRFATLIRRRYPRLRHLAPRKAIRFYMSARSATTEWRRYYIKPVATARYDNIFHCCIQKSGSQWIMSMLADPVFYRYTGLSHYHYQSRRQREACSTIERKFDMPFPHRSIVSPLYLSYEEFRDLPKLGDYRGFFVMRDPRDLVVSWYFSTMYSHVFDRDSVRLLRDRQELRRMAKQDGLRRAIEFWSEDGRFDLVASWARCLDHRIRLVRFEDLAGPHGCDQFEDLLAFLGVQLPSDQLERLWYSYSFRRLTGRVPGSTRERSHLRSGRAADWRKHLDETAVRYVNEVTFGLPGALGYPES